MYHFYVFLLIMTILRPINVFLRKHILQTVSVVEEAIFTQLVLLVLFVLFYIFVDKGKFKTFFKKIITNKNKITRNLLIYDIFIMSAIIIGGYILINEKIIYGESMKIGCYLILIALISCIHKNVLHWKYLLGIAFIILGIVFVESGNKLKYLDIV